MTFAKVVVDSLAILSIIALAPFAWIMRDGLGPDSATSTGFSAFNRWFMTFYAGPITIALIGLAVAVHYFERKRGNRSRTTECS